MNVSWFDLWENLYGMPWDILWDVISHGSFRDASDGILTGGPKGRGITMGRATGSPRDVLL